MVELVWSDLNFSLSLRQSLLTTLESEGRWAIERGLIQSNTLPNYLDYILLEPLEAVQANAVTVIR